MGIFNYIDTFFFISLGITFVFILLIVYHFKQQIKSLEQKNDTMFEIINNIVKEITNIRNIMVSPPQVQQNQIREVISLEREVPRIMVSDESEEEEESNDEEDESIEEHEEDSSDDEDSDDEEAEEEDDEKTIIIERELQSLHSTSDNIKIISVDIEDTDNSVTSIINETMDTLIHVEKVDVDSDTFKAEEDREPFIFNANNQDIYKKMNITALKALVISRGLLSDPSKLKKSEILKLLENQEA